MIARSLISGVALIARCSKWTRLASLTRSAWLALCSRLAIVAVFAGLTRWAGVAGRSRASLLARFSRFGRTDIGAVGLTLETLLLEFTFG